MLNIYDIYIGTENNMTDEFLISEMRNLKLRLLSDDIQFEPNEKHLKSEILDFIKSNFKDDIISGSLSLSIFGLLDRKLNDIDILIKDKNRYPSYIKSMYGDDMEDILAPNRLGVIEFRHKTGFFSPTRTYNVDFFEYKGSTYIDFNGIKLHNPIEIISYKLNMALSTKNISSSRKHRQDLVNLFNFISKM